MKFPENHKQYGKFKLHSGEISDVFYDVKRGEHASHLKEVFGTDDSLKIAALIIRQGDIQLTAEHKNRLREELKRKVIYLIHRNAINPQTNTPHPPQRIETALDEAKVKLDENKSAESQIEGVIKKLSALLPLKYEIRELMITIPATFAGQSFGVVKQYAKVLKDDWQNTGSLLLLVEIPAGLQNDLSDKLNHLTKGEAEISVVKTR